MKTSPTSIRPWSTAYRLFVASAIAAVVLATAPSKANADFMYQFDTVFGSNSHAPTNSAPWVDAIFQDVAGGVLLTITNVNLYGSEFVSQAWFNLIPTLQATSLTFTVQSSSAGLQLPNIATFASGDQVSGGNGNKADGDGYFDIVFSFATSMSGNPDPAFLGGESVSYLISGIAGLTASDFDSVSHGGSTDNLAALHVQNTASANSGSAFEAPSTVTLIPEPSSIALAAAGISLLGLFARRRR